MLRSCLEDGSQTNCKVVSDADQSYSNVAVQKATTDSRHHLKIVACCRRRIEIIDTDART